jgi:hypothetical protein
MTTPLVCSAGRTAGGCGRAGAAQVLVVHTDSSIHGGPLVSGTGVDMPYAGIAPVPETWPAVEAQLSSHAVTLIWFDSAAGNTQLARMIADLGQPASDQHPTADNAGVTTACGQLVTRVRAIAGL